MKTLKITAISLGTLIFLLLAAFLFIFPRVSGMPVYSRSHAAVFTQVTSSTDQFQYHPECIQVGAVYHYKKSNIDGTETANVWLCVASLTHIEVFKIYPGSAATTSVTSDMDWSLFSPSALFSYDIHPDHTRTPVIDAHLLPGDQYQFHVYDLLWSRPRDTFAPIGHYPVHNYNFDLASLNFSFRHLIDPTRDFEIGVQMPWFDFIHLGEMEYLDTARIHYLGEEACHTTVCRKYSISGGPFGSNPGTLWVNEAGGYFEKVEIPLRDNPSWKDFKLELTGIDQMSIGQWNQFILDQTDAYFSLSR